jgi:hypothetical protein
MLDTLNANPLSKRKFLHQASTASAVQVIWSHPEELHGAEKKALTYELQYGVGEKVNKQEQFRKIYIGRAHKCIITDLMPKTSYRFRVIAVMSQDKEIQNLGEWSDTMTVQTKESQSYDPNTFGSCAQYISKNAVNQEKFINFLQAGTILSNYGYSFGEHIWTINIKFEE